MRAGGGKGKGNSYEIKIARILSDWYIKNFPEEIVGDVKDYFWRTAGSGAKATVSRINQTSFVGDLTFLPNPERLNVVIECKDRKTASFNGLLTDKCVLRKWFYEARGKAKLVGNTKPVLLIFKLYRKKEDYVLYKLDSELGLFGSVVIDGSLAITPLEKYLCSIENQRILKEKENDS